MMQNPSLPKNRLAGTSKHWSFLYQMFDAVLVLIVVFNLFYDNIGYL